MNRWGLSARRLTIVLGVAASVFLALFLTGQGLVKASLWASVLSLVTGIVSMAAAVWPLVSNPSRIQLSPEWEVPEWVVGRPHEAGQVVAALHRHGGRTVGITTGMHGAGGFGKTTLARIVCADRRIRRRFRGGVYLVTVGRDTKGAAAMAAKVNDVIKLVSGEEATFTDPEIAGGRLGVLLETGPMRLLVIDDVWEADQLAPFVNGGRRCARLVTTRVPGLLGGRTQAVLVDQMSGQQARQLLTAGLPALDPMVAGGLLAVTGRWPLLLRLVNKFLANAAGSGADFDGAATQLLERLRTGGPAAVDDLLEEDSRGLQVGQPAERARAVRATIGASTSLLNPQDAQRFVELGVFAEDESIPFSLAARLWHATAGIDDLQATRLCGRLAELALVSSSLESVESGGLMLHDVVRDFLRGELGSQRLAQLSGALLDAAAVGLPAKPSVNHAVGFMRTAWWEIDPGDRYMCDHLIEHLLDAGRRDEAEDVASDLRWVGARLVKFGPAAPTADLSLIGTPRAVSLRTTLARAAHLLAPTEPPEMVIDVLHSRVADNPYWGPQVAALRQLAHRSRLVNRWPLPDLPDSALRRVLAGHDGAVVALALAPDGNWLATGDASGTVRIWDAATGRARSTLTGHRGSHLTEIVISPDSSWLVTCAANGAAKIWDAVTGQEQINLVGHRGRVNAVIAPDGSWLATVDDSGVGGKVRIWNSVTGKEEGTLAGHRGHQLVTVGVAPDSSWLATGGTNGRARIWHKGSLQPKVTLKGHRGRVSAVAISPDGTWLATADRATVQIWDVRTGQERTSLKSHHGPVSEVMISPDGSWLATISGGWPRIWNAATGQERSILEGRRGYRAEVMAIAPDGNWLATGGIDRAVRIWDTATGQEQATFIGHNRSVGVMAVARDGTWLASGDDGGTVRIWDMTTKQYQKRPIRSRAAAAITASPDGSWLATIVNGTLRIWDASTGRERTAIANLGEPGVGHKVGAIMVSPDSTWLAIIVNGTLRIWDSADGGERATITNIGRSANVRWYTRGHGAAHKITAVTVASDGRFLAIGDDSGMIGLWDAATLKEQSVFMFHDTYELKRRRVSGSKTKYEGKPKILAIVVAPTGDWIAARAETTYTGNVRIWDIANQREHALPDFGVTAIAIAPSGNWLVTDSGAIQVWDKGTGKRRISLADRKSRMNTIAIAKDGSWLAASHSRGPIRVWDVATGEECAVFPAGGNSLNVVAVSKEGGWLVSCDGGMVRTWDIATGRVLAALKDRYDQEILTVISPDDKWLAIAEKGTIQIWDPFTGVLQALMRVDNAIVDCTWLDDEGLAAASWAGLYVFDFIQSSSRHQPVASWHTKPN